MDRFAISCVAIGGITAGNCAALVAAKADFLAVIGAVWNHPDGPGAGVRAMTKVREKGQKLIIITVLYFT